LKLSQEWGEEGIKGNGGEVEFKNDIFDIFIVRTFVNATMYPTYNNKKEP
jgi:hypothetical protein